LPGLETLPHLLTVCGGREPRASRAEMLGDEARGGEEPLGVPRCLEALQAPLAWPRRLVGVVGAVVEIPVLAVVHTGQDLAQGRAIAFALIRDDHPRPRGQAPQQCAEAFFRSGLIPAALHEDVKDRPVLIDGPPAIVAFAMDREEHFIQMLRVARSGLSMAQLMGIRWPERPAPVPHGFVGQDDTTFGHERFDIPIAQAKAEVQPDTVADDLDREPMTRIRIRGRW
jgi:hypothetical protein